MKSCISSENILLYLTFFIYFTLYMFLRGVLQYFMTHSLRTIYRKAGA